MSAMRAARPGMEAHTQASVASKAKAMHSFRGSPGTGVSWIVFLCKLTALRMVRVCTAQPRMN